MLHRRIYQFSLFKNVYNKAYGWSDSKARHCLSAVVSVKKEQQSGEFFHRSNGICGSSMLFASLTPVLSLRSLVREFDTV